MAAPAGDAQRTSGRGGPVGGGGITLPNPDPRVSRHCRHSRGAKMSGESCSPAGASPTFLHGRVATVGAERDNGRIAPRTKGAPMTVVGMFSGALAAMAIVGLGAPSVAAQVPAGTITVDDLGQFRSDGQATISGTYSCEEGGFAFISGNLVQAVGRLAPIRGEFITEAVCTGETETWSGLVQGAGKYR